MNIEQSAIEKMIYEHTGFNPNVAEDAETIKHIKNLLEAFAKAYAQQQSEPVAVYQRYMEADGWEDCDKKQYDNHPEWAHKRIIYTQPPTTNHSESRAVQQGGGCVESS